MRPKQLVAWAAGGVTVTVALAASANSPGVTAEAVDHYYTPSGTIYSTIICIAEADNFRNSLLAAPGTIFTAGIRYTDPSVYDTDFFDPDKSGASTDDDTFNFDAAGNGLAYVCLHGSCDDTTTQNCTSAANCTSPGGGQSLPGVCIGAGPNTNSPGWCAYRKDRNLITSGDASGNHHSGIVDYSAGNVRWGESSNSTNWAGAGVNGGINFGQLSNSCGARPGLFLQEVVPIFAGMTVLGMIVPVTPQAADDVDAPARGTALANAYKMNPNGSISMAWADSIGGIPSTDGKDCPGLGTSYSQGGGFGIQGCGAQVSFSVDRNVSDVTWDQNTESWKQAIVDSNDSLGGQFWTYRYHCNYDCNTYPWTL